MAFALTLTQDELEKAVKSHIKTIMPNMKTDKVLFSSGGRGNGNITASVDLTDFIEAAQAPVEKEEVEETVTSAPETAVVNTDLPEPQSQPETLQLLTQPPKPEQTATTPETNHFVLPHVQMK